MHSTSLMLPAILNIYNCRDQEAGACIKPVTIPPTMNQMFTPRASVTSPAMANPSGVIPFETLLSGKTPGPACPAQPPLAQPPVEVHWLGRNYIYRYYALHGYYGKQQCA